MLEFCILQDAISPKSCIRCSCTSAPEFPPSLIGTWFQRGAVTQPTVFYFSFVCCVTILETGWRGHALHGVSAFQPELLMHHHLTFPSPSPRLPLTSPVLVGLSLLLQLQIDIQ